jgi:predicted pyridoxine 5'-phosphate oxidase superfamily flavin-nucleotide-binding protein
MKLEPEVKAVIENSAFLSLVTVNSDGTPHPIIAGKGEVEGNQIVFGIYKMKVTQKNLEASSQAWLVGATLSDGPKGFRLTGTAKAQGEQLIFTPTSVEVLI